MNGSFFKRRIGVGLLRKITLLYIYQIGDYIQSMTICSDGLLS